jgi:nitrogen-specific signal transduction histidine kinase
MQETTITPVQTAGSGITHYIAVCQDVSEQKRLREQLWQAQKMESVGRLAAGVAHDFNNILGIVLGYSELLLERANGDEKLRGFAREMHEAARRGATLTRQLLTFSRKQALTPEVLELNGVVADTAKMLQRLMGEDIELRLELGPEAGRVRVDASALDQVLMNLAANARDAMPEGGRVTVATSALTVEAEEGQRRGLRPGGYVRLVMTDTGEGMDEPTQAQIFEPFFTTKEKGRGTGLGLATVYGIVQQSGGDIRVTSKPGEGASFEILLPRIEEKAAKPEMRGAGEEAPGGRESVLVVDDEAGIRELTRLTLERAGYTVVEAESGAQAMALAESRGEPFDLLLTDVVMPGMSGRRLAEAMNGRGLCRKGLLMSGYVGETMAKQEAGEQERFLIQKPVSGAELLRKVREVLDAGGEPRGNRGGEGQ